MPTKIQWCDETINPLQDKIKGTSGRGYHCTKIGVGCKNCYAESTNMIRGNGLPFDRRKAEFELIPSMLEKPLKWKKPRKIFVQSMGDLFHKDVRNEQIDTVLSIVSSARTAEHTFLILTKRPERMLNKLDGWARKMYHSRTPEDVIKTFFSNVWLGVSVSTQEDADRLIPILLQIPAAKHFVSCEPLLEKINLKNYLHCGLSWCIIGAESGSSKRYFNPDWARRIIKQCKENHVPVFYKQDSIKKMPEMDGIRYAQYPISQT